MRHKSVALSRNDAKAGVIPIPRNITTGSIEIDINNVDLFMK
jgi:ribose transport system substrate-binding protein